MLGGFFRFRFLPGQLFFRLHSPLPLFLQGDLDSAQFLLELFDSLLGFRGPGSFRRFQGLPLGFGNGQALFQVGIGGQGGG